jgi:hypothetical protein
MLTEQCSRIEKLIDNRKRIMPTSTFTILPTNPYYDQKVFSSLPGNRSSNTIYTQQTENACIELWGWGTQLQFQRIIKVQCSNNLSLFKRHHTLLKEAKNARHRLYCVTPSSMTPPTTAMITTSSTQTQPAKGQKDWPSYHSSDEP